MVSTNQHLSFTQGSTYYFDLSDSSLYSATSGNNHILRLSTTPNGTHGGGSEYTTGVTKSASYIEVGTTGAFLQLVLETDAPDFILLLCKPLWYGWNYKIERGANIR